MMQYAQRPCKTWKRYRNFKIYADNITKSLHFNRHESRLLKPIVWSAATHGYEGWTIKKSDESRIEAFETNGLEF